eukprot:TRINITY_DN52066_c0_g2_i1.p1 TRINITY_DN52066_c0_g2~~TRINITY_DN52066_c0_g2_i1.p1  ORF type:complete len:307 (+),score=24.74 TRINITY_DN52066_c0_g2_i1:113-1033(+)
MCKESASNNGPGAVTVIDPANRTGKVDIPLEFVFNTLGLRQYNSMMRGAKGKPAKKQFSLCMLFQKSKCRSGTRCHQIHADRKFVQSLREAIDLSTKSCCDKRCQEQCDLPDTRKFRLDVGDVQQHALPTSLLGRTLGLEKLVSRITSETEHKELGLNKTSETEHNQLVVELRKLCRLHGEGRCLFGRDCKNIHICRVALQNLGLIHDREQKKQDALTFRFPSLEQRSPTSAQSPHSVHSPSNTEKLSRRGSFGSTDGSVSSEESSVGGCSEPGSPTPAYKLALASRRGVEPVANLSSLMNSVAIC